MSTRRVQFTLSITEYQRLSDLAREQGCTFGDLVREAVRNVYLEPLRLRSRLDVMDTMLAPFGALAEDDEAAQELRDALESGGS